MPYHPHVKTKKKKTSLINIAFSIIAAASPLITVPQVYVIYTSHQADGISLLSWSGYVVASACWLFYGIYHKEQPIVLNSIVGGFLSVLVVIGAILYR